MRGVGGAKEHGFHQGRMAYPREILAILHRAPDELVRFGIERFILRRTTGAGIPELVVAVNGVSRVAENRLLKFAPLHEPSGDLRELIARSDVLLREEPVPARGTLSTDDDRVRKLEAEEHNTNTEKIAHSFPWKRCEPD